MNPAKHENSDAHIAHMAMRHVRHVTAPLIDAVWPIYVRGRRGRLECVGSSILLRVRDELFLLTAAHVIDIRADTPLGLGLGRELADLDFPIAATVVPGGGSRDHDRLDLAVAYLESSRFPTLDPCHAVTLDQVFVVPDDLQSEAHVVVGYPSSKQPKSSTNGELEMRCASIACYSCPLDQFVHAGFHPRLSLLLDYDRRGMWNADGVRGTGVEPYGISGGAIWSIPDLFRSPRPQPKLAGVAVEWHKHQRQILGTRVQLCLSVIARDRPHLLSELKPWL